MNIIGLTGGVGSGKTKVLNFFRSKKIPCYESDKRAKYLVDHNVKLSKSIKSIFGSNVYNENGLDRKAIAGIVFKNKDLLMLLNEAVHPFVRNDFEKFVLNQKSNLIIKESAILFELGIQKKFNKIILLISPTDIRINRIIKRDNTSKKEVLNIINNQWPDKKKIPLADYVIRNLDWDDTLMKLEKVYSKIIDLV